MNLVQINERLKDLPEGIIRQYANGSNPEVPAYLALAEMQRRQKEQQQAANQQGAAQGRPSIKEQIEQSAGLMALQKAQMAQKQQQMMEPQGGPMPVPPGAPQPQQQPQQPQPEMMAGGGLARLPIRNDLYTFANGGIIAFGEGGDTPEVIVLPQNVTKDELDQAKAEHPNAIIKIAPPSIVRGQPEQAPQQEARAPAATLPTIQVPKGLPSVVGAANIGQMRSPLMDTAFAAASEQPEKPTAESTVQNINAMTPEYMREASIQKRADDFAARQAKARQEYEASKPSGLDTLIKVFGQAGQYKGLSGLGPAYAANREQQIARDRAFRRQEEADIQANEQRQGKQYEDIFGARTKDFTAQSEGFRKQLGDRTQSLAALTGADQRSIDEALNRLTSTELAILRVKSDQAAAGRPGERERFIANFMALKAKDPAKADAMMDAWRQSMGGNAEAAGENAKTKAIRLAMETQAKIFDPTNQFPKDQQDVARKKYNELSAQLAESYSPSDNAKASKSLPPGFKLDK